MSEIIDLTPEERAAMLRERALSEARDKKEEEQRLEEIRRQVEAKRREEQERLGGGQPTNNSAPTKPTPAEVLQTLPWNELGDATLLWRLNFGQYLHDHASGEWLRWNGQHLEVDLLKTVEASVEQVAALYEETAAAIEIEAGGVENLSPVQVKTLKKLRFRADRLRSRAGRRNCLSIAATDLFAFDGALLDQNPWLLQLKNGVYDLRSGEIRPGRLSDYHLRACPTEFQGLDIPCPVFDSFLLSSLAGDEEMVAFLGRLFGSGLVGKVIEHIVIVLYGLGRNGKSLLSWILQRVSGPMAVAIRSEMLMAAKYVRSSAAPSPDWMSLRGARFGIASEPREGGSFDPAMVKLLSGGDPIRARNPNDRYEITFEPSHTLILLGNHKPHAPADDFAFWERMILVPFEIAFVNRDPVAPNERRADPHLAEKLLKEAPGILAWMLRGCLEWQRQGLNPPEKVRAAVSEYRRDEDTLADFIDQCLVIDPDDVAGVKLGDLHEIFSAWWVKNVSKNPPGPKRFARMMRAKFSTVKRGVYHFTGIRLNQVAVTEVMADANR